MILANCFLQGCESRLKVILASPVSAVFLLEGLHPDPQSQLGKLLDVVLGERLEPAL